MGAYLKQELQQGVYSLAAVTAKDSIYLQNKWHKTPVHESSFEYFLTQQDAAHVFVSSRQAEMNVLKLNRLFSPIAFVEGNLSELHDGYFFFKEARPSTPLGFTDSTNRLDKEEKQNEIPDLSNVVLDQAILLDEVVIYSKRTPYFIIKQVIDALPKNYPTTSFRSQMQSTILTKVGGQTCLDFDFVADQYDFGYVQQTDRSIKSLKEIRWNTADAFRPETLREYHGLVYNSPIQYAPVLKKGKFKKFQFVLEGTKMHLDQEVYVIGFFSPRQHSTFTRRTYLSNYSGYLYVNVSDLAVVRMVENWDVTEFPASFKQGYAFKHELAAFSASKTYTSESTLTDFTKIGDRYFITFSEHAILGRVYTAEGESKDFTTSIDSHWQIQMDQNPDKMKFKQEEQLFKNVNHNPAFWADK